MLTDKHHAHWRAIPVCPEGSLTAQSIGEILIETDW
jgi:hypothetical protein